jgi:hypothetical protein
MEYLWLCLSAVAAGAQIVPGILHEHRRRRPLHLELMVRNWKISLLRFEVYV